MYKIAAIGDRDSMIGFSALGIETFQIAAPNETERLVSQLEEEGAAIILVTESLYNTMDEIIVRYRKKIIPVIVPIPEDFKNNKGISGISDSVR